jgi:membrane associated rhomboid family serine protease
MSASEPPPPDPNGPVVQRDPTIPGRLSRADAVAFLDQAGARLAQGEFADAAGLYQRVIGFDDPDVSAAALLGLAESRYRLNDEPGAVATWSAVTALGDTPSLYPAWRNIAAAKVRDGDLAGAIEAYRRADRLAPPEDKAEIANRLGWLAKETGDTGASRRYFSRARGDRPLVSMTLVVIAITSIISLIALYSENGEDIFNALQLDKLGVANGEYWRLWSATLLHGSLLHLGFNMYALYLGGQIVERWYGPVRFLVFYLACAAAGSTASFVFGGDIPSVGASGAIFGLFGVLLTANRIHHPVDRESRGLIPQLMFLIIVNIAFGFASAGEIDNAAHLGGLAAGLWLGALIPPTGVPTMSALWHKPGEKRAAAGRATVPVYVTVLGVGVVGIVVAAGLLVGTADRNGSVIRDASLVEFRQAGVGPGSASVAPTGDCTIPSGSGADTAASVVR